MKEILWYCQISKEEPILLVATEGGPTNNPLNIYQTIKKFHRKDHKIFSMSSKDAVLSQTILDFYWCNSLVC